MAPPVGGFPRLPHSPSFAGTHTALKWLILKQLTTALFHMVVGSFAAQAFASR